SHGPGHVGVRHGRGPRFRTQDRRGDARRGAAERGGDPRLSRRSQRRRGAGGGLMLLEVRQLCAFYGQSQAPFGLDFALAEGAIVTLLGANGAGKTTTLRALCGMVRMTGAVSFEGKPIGGRPTEDIVRLGVAHVPEGRGTFTRMTVEENLQLGAMT